MTNQTKAEQETHQLRNSLAAIADTEHGKFVARWLRRYLYEPVVVNGDPTQSHVNEGKRLLAVGLLAMGLDPDITKETQNAIN